jgi:hypothetical protein
MDDRVEKAFLKQKLGALKALGKFLADGLFDDSRSGEAN